MNASKYNHIIRTDEGENLVYNAFSNALVQLNEDYMHVLNNIEELTEAQKEQKAEVINALKNKGFIVDADTDQKVLLKHKYNKAKYFDKRLSLTLAPTLNCNFACSYCYENNEKGKMSEQTQLNIYRFVEKKIASIKELRLTWYGGEPLLAKEIVFGFSEKLKKLCIENNVKLTILMVSNGYLIDDATVRRLKEMNLNQVQITLDGPAEVHNKRRPLVSGKGTFNKILTNIIKLRAAGINTVIRVNIDKSNAAHIHRLLDVLEENNLKDIRVYLGHVIDENNNKVCDSYLNLQDYSETVLIFNKALQERGFKSSGNYPRQKLNYCGADHINSFVINYDGTLYKCWLDVGLTDKSFGNINALDNINLSKSIKYMSYDVFEYEKCKTCNILPVCMGGCPHAALKNNQPSCDSMKFTLKDTIVNFYHKLNEESRQ